MKKGPLSKKEKQFITENKNKEIEKIAEELSRSVAVVKKFHQTIKNENEEAQLPPKSGDLFARNKRYGVVTMTEKKGRKGRRQSPSSSLWPVDS